MDDQTAVPEGSALFLEQQQAEERMTLEGAKKYRERLEGTAEKKGRGYANSPSAGTLKGRALEPTAKLIAAMQQAEAPRPRGRGRPTLPVLGPEVCAIDAHILADLTACCAFSAAESGETLTRAARSVANAIDNHLRDSRLHEHALWLWNKQQENLKHSQKAIFRRRSIDGSVESMREWARREAPELAEPLDKVKGLGDVDAIRMGSALLGCFMRTGLVVETRDKVLKFGREVREWLVKSEAGRSMLRPKFEPMLCPPRPWTDNDNGGYLNSLKLGVGLVKRRRHDQYRNSWPIEEIRQAVSLIQSTPLRVNKRVFKVMREASEAGQRFGKVPPKHAVEGEGLLPLRAAPPHALGKTGKLHPEWRKTAEGKDWLRERVRVHEFNALVPGKLRAFANLMELAERYVERDRTFWHAYNIDWRGRVYPVCSLLSPQGDQFNRGLVEFAEGMPMTRDTEPWLAIHGANLYGHDKEPFEKRIEWVTKHTAQIIEAAREPHGAMRHWWAEADGGEKAWPFLAFCFEWADFVAAREAGRTHVTHLPIAVDGSNSGLQHLSAMVRDMDGALATNVAPTAEPHDVYGEVAGRVMEALRAYAPSEKKTVEAQDVDAAYVKLWLAAGVDRKICKQPTMTWVYSSTLQGMTEQIEKALDEADGRVRSKGLRLSHLSFTSPRQNNAGAARVLAPIVRKAIEGRLPKAAEAKAFLVACAKAANELNGRIAWTTPTGLPVEQRYSKATDEVAGLRKFQGSRRLRLSLKVERPNMRFAADGSGRMASDVDKSQQALAVAPNFVHSMDATHLLWTVNAVFAQGIRSLNVIHDSFLTHAPAMDALNVAIREQFVRLYSVDRLAAFRAELVRWVGWDDEDGEAYAELPEVPAPGTFDLGSVLGSQYFFA